jgi:hypothetical protein
MSIFQSGLSLGTALAEARMKDTCSIYHPGERMDAETFQTVRTGEAVFDAPVPCRMRSSSSAVSEKEAGEQSISAQDAVLSIPIGMAAAVPRNAVVVYESVDPQGGNPVLVGKTFRVKGFPQGSQMTAGRFTVELI